MERKTETKLAQSQRNFQSDKILKNKKNLQTTKESTKPAKTSEIPIIIQEPLEIHETTQKNRIIPPEIIITTPEKTEIIEENVKLAVMKQEDETSIISKNNKNFKIEPILKQKQEKKLVNNTKRKEFLKNSKNNQNEHHYVQHDVKKANKFENSERKMEKIDGENNQNNQEILDFKRFSSNFEAECNGDISFSQQDIKEHIKRITIKTFINIKNLIKPQENIRIICMAFIGLFGKNLTGFTEDFFENKQIKEWVNIQKYFENPGLLMNMITKTQELLKQGLIDDKNIQYAMYMLTEFSLNKNKENHEFNIDIIRFLAEFINSACKYYHNFKINSLKISPIKLPPPMNETTAKSEPKNTYNTIINVNEHKYIISTKKPKDRSVSSSKIDKEKMLSDRKKEVDCYLTKKKSLNKQNKLERIMKLKVYKPEVPSVLKDYLNKSTDYQNSSFSSKRKKNDRSFNDGNTSFQEEIRKAQKEIREMEATKTKILMLYEKQKRKDAEEEENQRIKEILVKEKENELKMKEILEKKHKEEQKEIRSFRAEMLEKKKIFEENLRNDGKMQEKVKNKDVETKKNQKKREESLEKLENIMFIRENKKKIKEQEINNQKKKQEFLDNKDALLKQKKKEILQMKENLETELFQTLKIFKKDK